MRNIQVNCGKCNELISLPLPESSVHSPCPNCSAGIWVMAFPALLKGPEAGEAGKALVVDDESSCFYHPTKRAEIPCDACGRFLCSLCDIDFYGRHLCPVCFEKGAEKGKLDRLQNKRTCYDDLALLLALIPVLLGCVAVVTAPVALFITIRYWNAPLSVVRKSRWRFVVAGIFAGIELLLVGAYIIFLSGLFSGQFAGR